MGIKKQYFKKIFLDLEKSKIPYVILRDEDFFNSKDNFAELDILIPRNKLGQLKKFFKKIPNKRIFKNHIDLTHPFLVRICKDELKMNLDFQVGGVAYCGSPVLKEEFLLKNIQTKNNLNYLNKEAEFLMLLVHGFVFKKKFVFFKKYEIKFLDLYKNSNKIKVHREIERMFGKYLTNEIITHLKRKDLKKIFSLQRKLRNIHLRKDPLRVIPIFISKIMRFRNYFQLDKIFYFVNPFRWAPLIAFIGSDGSGKTTLCKKTEKYLNDFKVDNKKFALGAFSPIRNPLKPKKKKDSYSKRVLVSKKEKSNLELFARILLQLPGQLKVLYCRKRGIVAISDRYPYDIVNFYRATGVTRFLVKKLFQKPTKAFYVEVSSNELIKRNKDLNLLAIKNVMKTITMNKDYFNLTVLRNENFKDSEEELKKHLNKII